jgi:hypothetical protein
MNLYELEEAIKEMARKHPGEVQMILVNRLMYLAQEDKMTMQEYSGPDGKLTIRVKKAKEGRAP